MDLTVNSPADAGGHTATALKGTAAAVTSVAICSLWSVQAHAQQTDETFQLETLELGSSTTSVYGVETSGVAGHLVPTANVWLHRTQRPFDLDSESVVDERWTMVFGGGFGLTDRLQLDLHLPVVLYQSGPGLLGPEETFSSSATGDVRLRAKWLAWEGGPFRVGVVGTLWTESGAKTGLVSNGVVRGEPGVVADATLGPALVSLNAGWQFRRSRDLAGYRHDDALRFGAAGRVPLVRNLGVEATLFGEWGPSADPANALPLEALGGAYWERDGVRISLGGGAGLTRSVGAPRYRIAAGVTYAPPGDARGRAVKLLELPDEDDDGIFAEADLCPREPETFDGFEDYDGCPDLDDDGDGVADLADACPGVAGVARKSGCPEFDVDGDSIDDAVDACPRQPEDLDGDVDEDGCPDGDDDATRADAIGCEASPGGCEEDRVKIVETTEEVLEKRLYFGTNSTAFQPETSPLLDELATIVADDPSIHKVIIEGHTDARGSTDHNLELSQARAKAVGEVLIERGIDPGRVDPRGKGESEPVDTNDTVEGRARNRRVEFRLIRRREPAEIAGPPSDPGLTLGTFRYDRRHLLVTDPPRFAEGSRLEARRDYLCGLRDDPDSVAFRLTIDEAIAETGTTFAGYSRSRTVTCALPDGSRQTMEMGVEVPGFALAGGGVRGDHVQIPRDGHTVLEIQYSGRAVPMEVKAPGLRATLVPVTPDRARLLLVDQGQFRKTTVTLGIGDRPILRVPVRVTGGADQTATVISHRVQYEVGLGSSVMAPVNIADTPAADGGIVSSVRYTARILASDWFSAGLIGDVGPLLGGTPVLFMPGVGFEAVVHAPWDRFRPFASAGAEAWFPGLDRTIPTIEASAGLDWEPESGAGVRAAARAVLITDSGQPVVVPGGFLGVFTSFR